MYASVTAATAENIVLIVPLVAPAIAPSATSAISFVPLSPDAIPLIRLVIAPVAAPISVSAPIVPVESVFLIGLFSQYANIFAARTPSISLVANTSGFMNLLTSGS